MAYSIRRTRQKLDKVYEANKKPDLFSVKSAWPICSCTFAVRLKHAIGLHAVNCKGLPGLRWRPS